MPQILPERKDRRCQQRAPPVAPNGEMDAVGSRKLHAVQVGVNFPPGMRTKEVLHGHRRRELGPHLADEPVVGLHARCRPRATGLPLACSPSIETRRGHEHHACAGGRADLHGPLELALHVGGEARVEDVGAVALVETGPPPPSGPPAARPRWGGPREPVRPRRRPRDVAVAAGRARHG